MPRHDFIVPANWQLPTALRHRLGRKVGRQRMMEFESHLLIVAHEVPEKDESSRQGLLFWRNPEGEWKSSDGTPGQNAIHELVNRYSRRIEEFDRIEASAYQSIEYFPLLDGLSPVLRSARNLHTVLVEARKAMPSALELIDVRDAAYEVSRNAELLYNDAKNGMDIAIVRRAEEQAAASERMSIASHRLNTMAAIFFPLATLSGIFGTSFTEGWSWSQTPAAFGIFVLAGLLSGLVLAAFIGRKPKS